MASGVKYILELVGSSPPTRNWKGIAIALLVILTVCGLIVTAVVILTPDSEYSGTESITLQDIFDGSLEPRDIKIKWLADSMFVYQSTDDDIIWVDADNNITGVLIDKAALDVYNVDDFLVSPDLEWVLLIVDSTKVFRHSTLGMYIAYNVSTKRLIDIGPDSNNEYYLQYCDWASSGHRLTFVYENDLYALDDPTSEPIQITNTGVPGVIFNGVPDWVYEEEILQRNSAVWWSSDTTKICYLTFNDTNVPEANFVIYGDDPYDRVESIRYPKPSYSNPVVTVTIYDLSTNNSLDIRAPSEMTESDYYVSTISWADDSRVAVQWLNRAQDLSIITLCSISSGQCIENDRQSSDYWVEVITPPLFSVDGSVYFTILPRNMGNGDGEYRHLAMVTAPSDESGEVRFLTSGLWDVTGVVAYHEAELIVYFISTETKPYERHLYSYSFVSDNRTCISCDIIEECTYFSAAFNNNSYNYLLHCEGPGVPMITLHNVYSNEYEIVDDNSELRSRYADLIVPKKIYDEIPLVDSDEVLLYQILMPQPYDENYKYPMILQVYNGPGSQEVNEKFKLDWSHYLSTVKDIVVVTIDGRGTGHRGEDFLHYIHKQLGTVEVDDQVYGAQYVMKKYSDHINSGKVAIWGWSYGGYVTGKVLAQGSGLFNCGISVAPVTDWRLYDSAYTERYMGQPTEDDNLVNYEAANIIDSRTVENFGDVEFLLVHGTADDNVHFQNSALLVKALTNADVQFRVQFYTDKEHSLRGYKVKRHLYEMMTDFLVDCIH